MLFRISLPRIEISRMLVEIDVDVPLTVKDSVLVGTELTTERGLGNGMFSLGYRRYLSDISWAQVLLKTLGIKI